MSDKENLSPLLTLGKPSSASLKVSDRSASRCQITAKGLRFHTTIKPRPGVREPASEGTGVDRWRRTGRRGHRCVAGARGKRMTRRRPAPAAGIFAVAFSPGRCSARDGQAAAAAAALPRLPACPAAYAACCCCSASSSRSSLSPYAAFYVVAYVSFLCCRVSLVLCGGRLLLFVFVFFLLLSFSY